VDGGRRRTEHRLTRRPAHIGHYRKFFQILAKCSQALAGRNPARLREDCIGGHLAALAGAAGDAEYLAAYCHPQPWMRSGDSPFKLIRKVVLTVLTQTEGDPSAMGGALPWLGLRARREIGKGKVDVSRACHVVACVGWFQQPKARITTCGEP
jgi:hypothetical protein